MESELHELIERGGADGNVDQDTAVRTLSTIYAAIGEDDNLTDFKKQVFCEIAVGTYRKLLRSSDRALVLEA